MNKKIICSLAMVALLAIMPGSASAWDLKSLLKKAGDTLSDKNTITNVLDNVLSTSDIEVKDLAGKWKVTGSAVSAKSDNILNQATAVAGTAVIEGKLDPYYKKYGLTGSEFTISETGEFTLKVKKLNVTGTIQKDDKGNFIFNFNTFGTASLGSVEAYVTKSANSLNIMFDTARLQQLLNGIASFSKIQLAQQAVSLLNSYDQIYVGFKMKKN